MRELLDGPGEEVHHTALSDQGNHFPCVLYGVYYLKDRGGQVSSVYHTCSMDQASSMACKHNGAQASLLQIQWGTNFYITDAGSHTPKAVSGLS